MTEKLRSSLLAFTKDYAATYITIGICFQMPAQPIKKSKSV